MVGGVSLFGGRGAILGMVLGAALLDVVDNILVLINAPETVFKGFLGAIIIVAVVLNTFIGKRARSVTSRSPPESPVTAASIGPRARGAPLPAGDLVDTGAPPPGGAGGDHVPRLPRRLHHCRPGRADKFEFLNPANLSLILKQIPNYGMVALGVGLLMIAGEFDLSVGSVFVVAPFAMATAYAAGIPLPVAILIGFGIAALIGLANGLITLSFGIPSFITTLGTLFIVRTSAPFIVGYARSLNFKPPALFTQILTGNLGPIPMPFVWFLGMALVCYLILNRHFLGNHFFAAGGNPTPRASPASTSSGPRSSPSFSPRSLLPPPGCSASPGSRRR